MSDEPGGTANGLPGELADLLRCLECRGRLRVEENEVVCIECGRRYPLRNGIPRVLRDNGGAAADDQRLRKATAESFAYEWEHFGQPRAEWRKNFLDYVQPYGPEFFEGRLMLDAGTGSGRHSREAAALGARVVAVDLGEAIEVARRNLPAGALTVQADLEDLPLEHEAFDFVMSIGVLHHLPDPQGALTGLARHARPGGVVQIYLYWVPERRGHRAMLAAVAGLRRLTTRLPPRVLHVLAYPIAALVYGAFVLPYRALRGRRRAERLVRALPLKAYADYPFKVCVNDQFDRFSAPLEQRFEADEVEAMMVAAGLEDVSVIPNNGWVATGRRPSAPTDAREPA